MSSLQPRLITSAEILIERTALRDELGYIPHGTGSGWSSYLWVSCDCPNCRDEYDPTGEESAKYLNLNLTSFFISQSDMPSFSFSKIAKESFLAAAEPGVYFDSDAHVYTLESFLEKLAHGLSPKRILHISANRVWDRYILSEETARWTRHTWEKSRGVWDSDAAPILHDATNEGICTELKNRHTAV